MYMGAQDIVQNSVCRISVAAGNCWLFCPRQLSRWPDPSYARDHWSIQLPRLHIHIHELPQVFCFAQFRRLSAATYLRAVIAICLTLVTLLMG